MTAIVVFMGNFSPEQTIELSNNFVQDLSWVLFSFYSWEQTIRRLSRAIDGQWSEERFSN